MKLLMEQWKKYLAEADVHQVSIDRLLPTEEMGHGKDHDCPSEECEEKIKMKMNQIESGYFEPIQVANQKPIVTARLAGKEDYSPAPKSGQEEPFLYVVNGHHRLEAAKRLGMKEVPVVKVQL